MKIYFFNPNSYDAEYFTIAENRASALYNLKNYLYKKTKVTEEDVDFCYRDIYIDVYENWEYIDDVEDLPFGYTLEEKENGDVFETELS